MMIACMCITLLLLILLGFPVAFTLAASGLYFALLGTLTGDFNPDLLSAIPARLYGVLRNEILVALPFFVFMGMTLERSGIAQRLIATFANVFRVVPNSTPITVVLIGALLAASTGIVGATVVTMGLLALPLMVERGHSHEVATGTICAAGTLGQIIPPSVLLVMLGDIISVAYQQVQLEQGIFSVETVTVADFFAGAMIPGSLLVGLYIVYLFVHGCIKPTPLPAEEGETERGFAFFRKALGILLPPGLLVVAVLGSILGGYATPTEAAAVGAIGALIISIVYRCLSLELLRAVMKGTMVTSAMIYMVIMGASVFSLVFRGFGGDELIQEWLSNLPGGPNAAFLLTMLTIFLLGFVIEVIEIVYVVIPLVAPPLLHLGFDPLWLGVVIAMNLQTSFLTPPMGYALFYLRGVASKEIKTTSIYKGVVPFIVLQIVALLLIIMFPSLVTWLPLKLAPSF